MLYGYAVAASGQRLLLSPPSTIPLSPTTDISVVAVQALIMRAGIVVNASGDLRIARMNQTISAKACLARQNHPCDCRWLRHGRDHAAIRQGEAGGAAMAGAVHGGRCGRFDARQDRRSLGMPLRTVMERDLESRGATMRISILYHPFVLRAGQMLCCSSNLLSLRDFRVRWCGREDSNLHGLPR
jgi:hypothetical protein